MRRAARIALGLVAVGVVVYASIFPLAEAFTEIVVLRSFDADGSPHDTRLTVIDRDGTPWVRGRPYRGWFRRVEAEPRADLRRGGVWRPVRASISRDPADAAAFDVIMLERYGLLYRFMDLMARMSSTEIPVRLDPRAAPAKASPCDPVDPVLAGSAFVLVTAPAPGARVASPLEVRGCSRTFESNVVFELRGRDGRPVASGHTSGGGVDGAASFAFSAAFSVPEAQLGHLVVFAVDASDGEGFPPGRAVVPLVLLPEAP
ncbi:MAG TPA: Gmad2 immunoglobulin-like domain-containing protein [Myxococcota bacterium]|nr:Gmad2 immunoglobulin-like domain-containing protein [Myxococcota bacterium]